MNLFRFVALLASMAGGVMVLAGSVRPSTWPMLVSGSTPIGRPFQVAMTGTFRIAGGCLFSVLLAGYFGLVSTAGTLGPVGLQRWVISPTLLVIVGVTGLVGGRAGHRIWLLRPMPPGGMLGRFELTLAGVLVTFAGVGVIVETLRLVVPWVATVLAVI